MEANNKHKIDGPPAPTNIPRSGKQNSTATSNSDNNELSSLPRQQHNNNDNMALHQQPQAPHQWTPLVAEAKDNQPFLHDSNSKDEENIEAKGDNKDQEDVHVVQMSHTCRKAKKWSRRDKELVAPDEVRGFGETLRKV